MPALLQSHARLDVVATAASVALVPSSVGILAFPAATTKANAIQAGARNGQQRRHVLSMYAVVNLASVALPKTSAATRKCPSLRVGVQARMQGLLATMKAGRPLVHATEWHRNRFQLVVIPI